MEVLLVPWAPSDEHRVAVWSHLKPRHLQAGWGVIEGRCDGSWCKATAVADALARTAADLLVIHDADVWTDGLDAAVAAVKAGSPWAVPHRLVHRLEQGQEPGGQLELQEINGRMTRSPYTGYAGGGVTVIRRDVYEGCPLDPRFVGWGQEDAAWAMALTTLHGQPWRGEADLWHWWHPPQPRESRVMGSPASRELHRAYKAACRAPEVMRELIEEAKACSLPTRPGSGPS